MKRRLLIKKLEEAGFKFERYGANHDIYRRGKVREAIERHNEVPENLAKAILKRNGIK